MSASTFDRGSVTLFLGGKSETADERCHLQLLAMHLKKLGYKIFLPMDEARVMLEDAGNLDGLPAYCDATLERRDVILVAEYSAAKRDADTDVDYGIAMGATHRAIVYTIDGSAELPDSMFHLPHTSVIHCEALTEENYEGYHAKLASRIDEAAQEIMRFEHRTITADDVEDMCP